MITIEQCRAARGLLDWTQQKLADMAGLSKTAINNFEKGYSDIKADSLRAIRDAFEKADIEFTPDGGLRKKSESVRILKGKTAFQDLLADMEQSLSHDNEILISHLDLKFSENYGLGRMADLLRRCRLQKIRVRLLGTQESVNPPWTEASYRILSPDMARAGPVTLMYGQRKTALILWGRSVILLVDSQEAAESQRRHFENLWETAQTAPVQLRKRKGRDSGEVPPVAFS